MSRYPSATWKPIRDTSTKAVQKDILCLHTMVGYLSSTWSYFDRLDIQVYSHIGVGGIWGGDVAKNLDGVAWQMADTDYRAAANLDGNWRVISVETADNAARPIQPWTPKQCNTIVNLMVDAHRLDGIPLVLIPDSKLGRRGIAYHRLGCDPYRVAGGELWSSAVGKDCPTDPRIKQLPGLVKRAQDIVAGNEEDDLPYSKQELTDITRAAVQQEMTTVGDATRTAIYDLAARAVKDEAGKLIALTIYGDSRTDLSPPGSDPTDTHAENIQAVRREMTDGFKAINDRLDALAAQLAPAPAPGA